MRFPVGGCAAVVMVLFVCTGCATQVQDSVPGLNVNFQSELGEARRAQSAGPGSNPALVDLSGDYKGTGMIGRNPGGTCKTTEPVYNFHVRGSQVSFGEFNGTIQANGSLEMIFRETWVIGQFNGPHFAGRYIAPACSYNIVLDRVG